MRGRTRTIRGVVVAAVALSFGHAAAAGPGGSVSTFRQTGSSGGGSKVVTFTSKAGGSKGSVHTVMGERQRYGNSARAGAAANVRRPTAGTLRRQQAKANARGILASNRPQESKLVIRRPGDELIDQAQWEAEVAMLKPREPEVIDRKGSSGLRNAFALPGTAVGATVEKEMAGGKGAAKSAPKPAAAAPRFEQPVMQQPGVRPAASRVAGPKG